jgi:hypothetical protein
MRHKPNLRYTARGRPQIWQRRRNLVENFGFCFALASFDALAIFQLSPFQVSLFSGRCLVAGV